MVAEVAAQGVLSVAGEPAEAYRLRLPFHAPPLTANDARRGGTGHYHSQSRAKRDVAAAVVAVVRHARVPHLDRLRLRLVWYAPDYGRRDCSGLQVMLKACEDALTPPRDAIPKGTIGKTTGKPREKGVPAKLGVGIIDDDHAGILVETSMAIELGCADPRIELELYPLPPAPPGAARRRR